MSRKCFSQWRLSDSTVQTSKPIKFVMWVFIIQNVVVAAIRKKNKITIFRKSVLTISFESKDQSKTYLSKLTKTYSGLTIKDVCLNRLHRFGSNFHTIWNLMIQTSVPNLKHKINNSQRKPNELQLFKVQINQLQRWGKCEASLCSYLNVFPLTHEGCVCGLFSLLIDN